jgi:hypothetical protein
MYNSGIRAAIIGALLFYPVVAFSSDAKWRGEGWYLLDDGVSLGYGGWFIDSGPFASKDACETSPSKQANPNYGGFQCVYLHDEARLEDMNSDE